MPLREPFPGFPPPLTTRPEGLLSMLGLQTNGRYPQHLAEDSLLPTIDLLPWYLESRAEIQSVQGHSMAAAVPGGFIPLYTVPAQEVWVLLAFTIQPVVIATGCTVQLTRTRSNDNLSRLALGAPVAWTATTFPLCYSDTGVRGLIFRPTVQIGYTYVTGGGAAGNSLNSCLRFVRCNI